MTPTQRALRTLLQVIVAGGFTGIVDQLAHGLSPSTAGFVLAGWTVIIAFAHNQLEASGVVPALLGAKHTEQGS